MDKIVRFMEYINENSNYDHLINLKDVEDLFIEKDSTQRRIGIVQKYLRKEKNKIAPDLRKGLGIGIYNTSQINDLIDDFIARADSKQLLDGNLSGNLVGHIIDTFHDPKYKKVELIIKEIEDSGLMKSIANKTNGHHTEILNKFNLYIYGKASTKGSAFRNLFDISKEDIIEGFHVYLHENPGIKSYNGTKLDKVVDFNGDLLNISAYLNNKGNVIQILSGDNTEYAAGIDSNGSLHAKRIDREGNVIDLVRNPIYNKNTNSYWNINNRYADDNKGSTGWNNVKVDKDMFKKVRRFSIALGGDDTVTGLEKKLKMLSNPSSIRKYAGNTSELMRKNIVCIILLKYLQEIKDNFTPSSSGYLFETFLSGLISARVPDNGAFFDMVSQTNYTTYQIKFVSYDSDSIELNLKKDCSEYLLALKENSKIHIFRLSKKQDGATISQKRDLNNFLVSNDSNNVKVELLREKIGSDICITLDLSKIETHISTMSIELEEIINGLYSNIDDLNTNVETIITGVNKDNIEVDSFDDYYSNSNDNLEKIGEFIKKLDFDKISKRDNS